MLVVVEVVLVVGGGFFELVVVGGGGGEEEVVVGSGEGSLCLGVGVGEGVVGSGFLAGCCPEPSAKYQEPWRTPTLVGAKNSKRPSVRSRPPEGQPGHSSTIVTVAVLPSAVRIMVLPQFGPG